MNKKKIKSNRTKSLKDIGPYFNKISKSLKFDLTKAQKRVVSEIHSDMKKNVCMNRLLQGDVGSGKTIVSILSASLAVGNNVQVALMVPTEILAVQHYESFIKEMEEVRITCCLLIGNMNKKERMKILDNIKIPIQGGLDPKILLTDRERLKKEATKYLDIFKDHPYIFNLGHGVLPETDPNMMDYLVKIVKDY